MRWVQGSKIPWYVVVSAAMVCIVALLRLLAFHIEGADDATMTQLLTSTIVLFTGSFVVARALSERDKRNGGDK